MYNIVILRQEYLYMKNPEYEGGYVNPFQDKPFTATKDIKVKLTL